VTVERCNSRIAGAKVLLFLKPTKKNAVFLLKSAKKSRVSWICQEIKVPL
jgi:hypothetical protein